MTNLDHDLQPISVQHVPDLQKLWSAYLRELALYSDEVEVDMELQDHWWTKPEDLYGMTILAQGQPAGFMLIMGERYSAAIGESTEFHVHEMYVDPKHRGTGLARWALREALAARPGTWSLHAMRKNEHAVRFWQAALSEPAYELALGSTDDDSVSFHFHIAQPMDDQQ